MFSTAISSRARAAPNTPRDTMWAANTGSPGTCVLHCASTTWNRKPATAAMSRDGSCLTMTSRKGGTALKKWFFAFMLLTMPVLITQLAVAQKTTPAEPQKETGKEPKKQNSKGSGKESHKDYADMKITECNECHKGEGVAPNHDADWLRSHRLLAN